jgi:MFS family permease
VGAAAALRESRTAFAGVFANPDLRRIQLAFAGSEIGSWAASVALAVLAFRSAGTGAVSVVVLVQMLPAALAGPFLALLGDRFPRRRVMIGADVVRAVLVGAASALAFADAPIGSIYAIAAVVAVTATAFRPAEAAILPTLARTPDELTAANVATSTLESLMSFAGPAIAGVLLAVAEPAACLALTAGAFVWSAALIAGVRHDEAAVAGRTDEDDDDAGGVVRELVAGGEAIVRDPPLRLLVGLFAAQVLVWGVLYVLLVPISFELLDTGEEGFGSLLAALGVGGLAGAFLAAGLVGRRLSLAFGASMVLWGAPIALIPVWPEHAVVLVLLGIVGLSNTVADVAGMTLLQRGVRDEVLARAFGVFNSLLLAMMAAGSALAPALKGWLGLEGALIAIGVSLPALTLLCWRRFARIDAAAPAPGERLVLLRRVPFLAPLPAPALEHLAGSLAAVEVEAGQTVFHEGDRGDRFYVIDRGEVEVRAAGRLLRTLGPGEFFGEIALVRDVPRTATVAATTSCSLLALAAAEFLGAVTGHASSAEAADAVVVSRLGAGRRPPGGA